MYICLSRLSVLSPIRHKTPLPQSVQSLRDAQITFAVILWEDTSQRITSKAKPLSFSEGGEMNGATTSVPDRYYSFVLTHDLALLRGEVLCAAPIRAIIRSVGQLSGQDVFFPSVHESRSGHYSIKIVVIRL